MRLRQELTTVIVAIVVSTMAATNNRPWGQKNALCPAMPIQWTQKRRDRGRRGWELKGEGELTQQLSFF